MNHNRECFGLETFNKVFKLEHWKNICKCMYVKTVCILSQEYQLEFTNNILGFGKSKHLKYVQQIASCMSIPSQCQQLAIILHFARNLS